jgi:hypothetical protein
MRRASIISALLCAAALAAVSPQARADSYRYDYSFYDPGIGYYNFVYDSPTLITTDESFLTPSSCTALGASCNQVGILAASGEVEIYGTNSLSVPGLPSSFFELGSNTYDFSSITITQDTDTSPVPEPSTLALLATGLLGVAATMRKSRRLA